MELASMVKSAVLRATEPTSPENRIPRIGMVVDMSDTRIMTGFIPSFTEKQLFPYSRPDFLYYSEEETQLSGDKLIRPIVCPKFPHKMPLYAGYAEVINEGKTVQNEDQATAKLLSLVQQGFDLADEAKEEKLKFSSRSQSLDDQPLLSGDETNSVKSMSSIPRAEAAIFAVLDGHAGAGAAVAASKCLHEHIRNRLNEVLEYVLQLDKQENLLFGRRRSESSYSLSSSWNPPPEVTSNQLVIGALEAAFVDMDTQISEDKNVWRMPGGCAAIAALVFLGKIYIANAGDCRSVLVTSTEVKVMSKDFTPATERKRIQSIAYHNPELLGNCFSRLEYSRQLHRKDLKSKVLYKDWFMDGWASKTVTEADLKPPLISSYFRKKRLLNTIGVSRGFGDQHLLTVDERLHIKPFLTPVPEVRVIDVRHLDSVGDRDVLIMASDGLWDVVSNEDAALIVRSTLGSTEEDDPTSNFKNSYSISLRTFELIIFRYTMAAQELVVSARGIRGDDQRWTTSSGGHASTDDITAFVIPLKYCIAPLPADIEEDDDEMISLNPS